MLQQAIQVFAQVIKFLFFARIIMSWFSNTRGSYGMGGQIFSVIHALTEPILGPLRGMLQRSPISSVGRVIDFSPIFGYFLVDAVAGLLVALVRII
jgi:uncharacterized protein YggT (Ycf19 family)